MSTLNNADTKECRVCHRIGSRQFVPVGSEEWACANDRACYRRFRIREVRNQQVGGEQR